MGSGSVTATYNPTNGGTVTALVSFNTLGDGGAPTDGAQISLILVDDPATQKSIDTISSLSSGYLVASVSGISKTAIVQFSSTLGEIPIDTAATDNGKAYVQILAGTTPGAGTATATLIVW